MKTKDEASWQARRAALLADGETGKAFLACVEDWAKAAEEHLLHADHYGPTHYTEMDAARDSLPEMEVRYGRIGAHFLGQMLWVLGEHWFFGHELMGGLSVIERRLVEDCVIIKVAEEQVKAEETHNDGDSAGAGDQPARSGSFVLPGPTE